MIDSSDEIVVAPSAHVWGVGCSSSLPLMAWDWQDYSQATIVSHLPHSIHPRTWHRAKGGQGMPSTQVDTVRKRTQQQARPSNRTPSHASVRTPWHPHFIHKSTVTSVGGHWPGTQQPTLTTQPRQAFYSPSCMLHTRATTTITW